VAALSYRSFLRMRLLYSTSSQFCLLFFVLPCPMRSFFVNSPRALPPRDSDGTRVVPSLEGSLTGRFEKRYEEWGLFFCFLLFRLDPPSVPPSFLRFFVSESGCAFFVKPRFVQCPLTASSLDSNGPCVRWCLELSLEFFSSQTMGPLPPLFFFFPSSSPYPPDFPVIRLYLPFRLTCRASHATLAELLPPHPFSPLKDSAPTFWYFRSPPPFFTPVIA